MVRPERFELPASWFVARRSIQLSYGRARGANITTSISELLYGGEGGITRRSAPRPFGAALRALSPLRRCRSNLNENVENLLALWRRGRDCSRLRRSSLANARDRLRRRSGVLRRRCRCGSSNPGVRTPHFHSDEFWKGPEVPSKIHMAEREGFEPSMGF